MNSENITLGQCFVSRTEFAFSCGIVHGELNRKKFVEDLLAQGVDEKVITAAREALGKLVEQAFYAPRSEGEE